MQTIAKQCQAMQVMTLESGLQMFLWFALLTSVQGQQEHPLADIGPVAYEFRLGHQLVGFERVKFSRTGWAAEDRFKREQNRRQYAARWEYTEAEGGAWQVTGTRAAQFAARGIPVQFKSSAKGTRRNR